MRGLVIAALIAACGPTVVRHEPPPGPPPCAPDATCEAVRLSGWKIVDPDIPTQNLMVRRHARTLHVTEKVCIGADGNVSDVTPLESSGFPNYDRDVAALVRTWRYRPFIVHGVPAPVCTVLTMKWQAHK